MKVAIDTNAYVEAGKDEARSKDILKRAEMIFVPLIVLAELRCGFAHGRKREANEKELVFFLNSPRVEILPPDEQTAYHYASLYGQLRRQGTPIPTNDIWIAALVIQHDLRLLTRDQDFDHLPQILRA